MQEEGHHRQPSNMEDLLYQIDANSIDANKDISPSFPQTPNLQSTANRKLKSDVQDYVVKDDEEMLTFTSFDDNALQMDFEDDSTLRITGSKDAKLTDSHFDQFERLTHKLSAYNSKNSQPEPETYLKWIYENVMWYFKAKTKKLPRHLRITKVIVSLSEYENIGDQGLEYLTEFLKCFENLKYLEFEVKNTKATDQTLGLVSSLLGTLKYCTYFYIDFSECNVTDEGIFFLANTLKSKPNLEEIWLRFSWCPNDALTNESLLTISRSLESVKKLKVLLLEFNGQSHIGSKGLSAVLSAIKEKDLQKLYLYFEKSQVNDKSLTYAGEILPKLWKLDVFGLNLANSNFVTVKGIEALEKGLENMYYLRTGLYLYFNGCLGLLDKERMKTSIDNLIEAKKVKNYVIEFE